jgi:hypothetical protein
MPKAQSYIYNIETRTRRTKYGEKANLAMSLEPEQTTPGFLLHRAHIQEFGNVLKICRSRRILERVPRGFTLPKLFMDTRLLPLTFCHPYEAQWRIRIYLDLTSCLDFWMFNMVAIPWCRAYPYSSTDSQPLLRDEQSIPPRPFRILPELSYSHLQQDILMNISRASSSRPTAISQSGDSGARINPATQRAGISSKRRLGALRAQLDP